MAQVVQLRTYPIKGCAPTLLPASVLTPAGLRHDRTFMVTDESGRFRSQRRDYRLAIIRPDLDADGRTLTLRADGTADVRLDVDLTAARRPVEMFGTPYQGIDQGDDVAAWLSAVLQAPSRLVRVPPEHDRVVAGGESTGTSAYADSSALLMVSQSSLAQLNTRITERGGRPVEMDRFRPNLIIDGWPDPHTEDRVRHARIGTAGLRFDRQAVRCSVPLVDQRTGRRAGPEPLRTLATYRRIPAGGLIFGVKFAVADPGSIAVGDDVQVLSWSA